MRLRHSRINRVEGIHRQGLGHQPRKLGNGGPIVAREVLFDLDFGGPPGSQSKLELVAERESRTSNLKSFGPIYRVGPWK